MGHVARCIPIIDLFVRNKNKVYVAGSRSQIEIIGQYFSDVHWIEHDGYPFNFGRRGFFRYDLMKKFYSHLIRWRKERSQVENYCQQYAIDLVVSDHRYGFRSRSIYSIFMTHQVQLPLFRYEGILQFLHLQAMRRFDEIWIPDDQHMNFAGKLSIPKKSLKFSHIGIQSRFKMYDKTQKSRNGIVVVVSGPLSYARQFVVEQIAMYKNEPVTIILTEELCNLNFPKNMNVLISKDWKKCDEVIMGAGKIVSRSGYSTLMDLIELDVPFLITPTPGQSEQEYLHAHWMERKQDEVSPTY